MLIQKHILAAAVFAAAMFAYSSPVEAKSCKVACAKFRSCVVAFHKGKATPAQRKKLYLGCMKTCRQNRAKVLQCYKVSRNSCPRYWGCVKRHYKR